MELTVPDSPGDQASGGRQSPDSDARYRAGCPPEACDRRQAARTTVESKQITVLRANRDSTVPALTADRITLTVFQATRRTSAELSELPGSSAFVAAGGPAAGIASSGYTSIRPSSSRTELSPRINR